MDRDDRLARGAFLEEAETSLGRDDCERALDLARTRLDQLPGDPDARIVLCRIRVRQGRLEEAWEMLEDLEETLVGLSRVYALMGDICLKKGMQDSAQSYYRKFAGLNPDAPFPTEVAGGPQGCDRPLGTDAGDEGEEGAPVPSGFQTVTLAELYIRQGHFRQAAEVLEAILQNDPGQEKAAGMLRELQETIHREASAGPPPGVVAELSRWLDHIHRLRSHAA
jgi:tetratricopeptide (TPR) repeat protein